MKKWVGLMILGLVLLGMVVWYILRMRTKPTVVIRATDLAEEMDTPLAPPAELAENYDPTVNEARFRIEGIDENAQSLELKPVWPEGFARTGTKNSKITCKWGDIRVFDQADRDKGKSVTRETLFTIMQATPLNQMILGGVCAERECREIARICRLFINESR